jgi:Capsule assembly protein Wzi/PAP2 superfamily
MAYPARVGVMALLLLSAGVCPAQESEKSVAADKQVPGSILLVDEHSVFSTAKNRFAVTTWSRELPPGEDPDNRLFKPFAKHLLEDQKNFWMSGREITRGSAKTIVPFMAFTGLLIGSDSWLSKQVPDRPSQLKLSKDFSNYATYSLIAGTGGAFLLGHLTGNDHLRETAFLSGEAALNSSLVAYLLKGVTQRPRPLESNGHGSFFQGGGSFPSEHSAVAWAVASTVAHEYPGPLTKLLAYGLASGITVTRMTSKQHFASDVFVGSVLGWYFARQVYRAHHDKELGGTAWGDVGDQLPEGSRNPESMGSPEVPVDSWVYPVFDRLAALGYLQTSFAGIRPWTRMECARLLDEAAERFRYDAVPNDGAEQAYATLTSEFADELRRWDGAANVGIALDSVYARIGHVSGQPLRDSYHFAQTLSNDFGRPYGEGANAIAGASVYGVAGPLFFYAQGEYQHAGRMPAYPQAALQAITQADQSPALPNPTAGINRFLLLNGSVGLTFRNLRISFGRQSQWLGPGESGSLLYSDNARPIVMLQVQSASPFTIPLVSRLMGPAQTTFFVGQLSGQQWVFNGTNLVGPYFTPQPFIHGNKLNFRPTPNLEIGVGLTAIFGGPGLPFTWSEFLRTFYSHKASVVQNPAKRFSSVDVRYRVPGLRKWLTVYVDSLVGDEISPLISTRPVLNPGIYMPQVPKIPKLDLRIEGVRDPFNGATANEFPPGFSFFDRRYRSGYTNDGNMIGSWIGRGGIGAQAWANYWLSPRTKFQAGYRHQQNDTNFIGGGHLTDVSARADVALGPMVLSATLQYERWAFPLLAPTPQTDVAASFQMTFYPHVRLQKKP